MGELFDPELVARIQQVSRGERPLFPYDYGRDGVDELLDHADQIARRALKLRVPSGVVICEKVEEGSGFGSQSGTVIGPVTARGWAVAEDADGHAAFIDHDGGLWVGLLRNPRRYGGNTLAVPLREVMAMTSSNFNSDGGIRSRGDLGAIAIGSGLAVFAHRADLLRQAPWYTNTR